MGFLSILKKALPHFADAERIISAAKKDGAKGAAVSLVKAILGGQRTSAGDAALANAAAINDLYADIQDLRARVLKLEKAKVK